MRKRIKAVQALLRKVPASERVSVGSVLDAATNIVAKAGLAALTPQRVSELAGVSGSFLKQYFPSKESIFFALAERTLTEDVECLRQAMDESSELPWEEAVHQVMGKVVALYEKKRSHLPLMLEHLPKWSQMAPQVRARETIDERVAQWIAHKRGVPVDRQLEQVAFVLQRAVVGVLVARYTQENRNRFSAQHMEDELTHLVVGYLRPLLGEGS